MSKTKENRNKDLVLKRKKDNKKWSWRKLAERFHISAPRAIEIYKENEDKFDGVRGVDKTDLT